MADEKYRVAIIDDEIQILTMLEKYLNKSGKYNIRTFSDSTEGLRSVLSESYDMVLLDIMMPKMDGIEVLDNIKEKKPNTKVMMMTAFSTLDRVLKSHKIGADHYIMKPFESLTVLEEKINNLIKA